MSVFFWYLVKHDLFSVYATVEYTSLFTRYQNNTAMFIWSGCRNKKRRRRIIKRLKKAECERRKERKKSRIKNDKYIGRGGGG